MEKTLKIEKHISTNIIDKELLCPHCEIKFKQKDNITNETIAITCPKCDKSFWFIKCYHCKKNVYSITSNYFESVNLKCPYLDCGKWFSKSSCEACTRVYYYPDKNLEGSVVKCPFQDCNKNICKITCPGENCGTKIVIKDGKNINYNYREGMAIYCKNPICKIWFQKINCFHCYKRLIFMSQNNDNKNSLSFLTNGNDNCFTSRMNFFNGTSKDLIITNFSTDGLFKNTTSNKFSKPSENYIELTSYIEGQIINCVYEDCLKSCNKVYCPSCQQLNIFPRGTYQIGSLRQCVYDKCGKFFSKIFCPKCFKTNNFLGTSFTEGQKVKCIYKECDSVFNIVNCIYCSRINIWKNSGYIIGQNILCAYPDCQKPFSKPLCPHCMKLSINLIQEFSFGLNYKCTSTTCELFFTNLICPDCYSWQNVKGRFSEGCKIICNNDKCKMPYINFNCAHCKGIIMDKGAIYKLGQTVVCPYSSCMESFNFLVCIFCKRGIHFKENNYLEGQLVDCPYSDCGKFFNLILCPQCLKYMTFSSTRKSFANTVIQCFSCKMQFTPGFIESKIFRGLPLYTKQPSYVKFFDPIKDYIELITYDSIYANLKIYINSNDLNSTTQDQIAHIQIQEPASGKILF